VIDRLAAGEMDEGIAGIIEGVAKDVCDTMTQQ
jgi:hypothetical protein